MASYSTSDSARLSESVSAAPSSLDERTTGEPNRDKPEDTKSYAVDIEKAVAASPAEEKLEAEQSEHLEQDPNIVDFDGPDDPARPENWPNSRKWTIVALLAAFTFVSPLASSMFAPGIPELLAEFNAPENLMASFVVSVFLLGYAFGPLVIAPMSELYGRQHIYTATLALFIIFTVACALSTNIPMLTAFRFFAGFAGSAPVTIGAGTVTDMFRQEERGSAIAIWALGPLLGPTVGPIAGGFLAEACGWRWVFWVIAIATGAVGIFYPFLMRETYHPTILAAKTKRLQKETGNQLLRSKLDKGTTPTEHFKLAIKRPLKLLLLSPIVSILSFYMALFYGYIYLVFTTITQVYENDYHFAKGIVGLVYIGIGTGMILGLTVFGYASDKYLKKLTSSGKTIRPEDRLPFIIPSAISACVGLLIYGWCADYHVFWFVPIFGTAFIGVSSIAATIPITAYLVDAFPMWASSATAAGTILRSIFGALLPLAGPSMYAKLGLGWGNTLLAFLSLACVPLPFLLIKYGEAIRTHPKWQIKL